VKATEEPEHQYRVIIGLDFEQHKRVLANPFAAPMECRCHQIDLQSSEAMRVTSNFP